MVHGVICELCEESIIYINFLREINQNCRAQRQLFGSLQGSLESTFTSLSCDVGVMSRLKAIPEIQLVS